MTRTGDAARPPEPAPARSLGFFDWVNLHTRELAIGLVLVAVAATGWALYGRSKTIKSQRAERAYFEAQRNVVAGNLPLAQTDLEKMITRFDGTRPATRAGIALAQVYFDQGKHQEGIKVLEKARGSAGSDTYESSIEALLAAGYENLGKHKEAAEHYARAAEEAQFDADRNAHRANAARAYQAAGDAAKAKELWSQLATDQLDATSAEAHIRMGELDAKPANKS